MKLIGNIFGFDCVTCKHNRHCYGGNLGNQFRYCQKSIEKLQNIEKLEQDNKELKENWNELKKDIGYELIKLREPNEYNEGLYNAFNYINNKMQELEQGSDRMTAKEMFEKLGYTLMNEEKIFYKGYNSLNRITHIVFFDNKKLLITQSIGLAELQAINKQVEELGWNN